MPYRRAYLGLLALFPLILLAFWPGYFGQLRSVPGAVHAHGLTATLWLMLLTWQSWSARAARLPAHRTAGLALFLFVPLFTAGGLLAIRDMAAQALAATDHFNAIYGFPLAFEDAVAVLALLVLVGWAVAMRRRTVVHAAAMLATAWLVLPPILTRLLPALPGLHSFVAAVYAANVIAAGGALLVTTRERRGARPFLFVVAVLAVQIATFQTLAASAAWTRIAVALVAVPPTLLAAAGIVASAVVLWLAWRVVPPRAPRRIATA